MYHFFYPSLRRTILPALLLAGSALAGDFDEVRLRTQLRGGPIGGVAAAGTADFRLRPSRGDRAFSVELENMNLPAGTVLEVLVNGASIGTLRVSGPPARGGELELNSRDGASVPTFQPGDVVAIRGASGGLLSGVLQRRPLDDSPMTAAPAPAAVTPAAVPDDKTTLRSPLTGGALGGVRPSGEVEFRHDGRLNTTRLFVEVNGVNVRTGDEVEVEIGGRKVGRVRLRGGLMGWGGELELDSRNGDSLPSLRAGDMVRISNASGPILAGALQRRTFDDNPSPSDLTGAGGSSTTQPGGAPAGGATPSGSSGSNEVRLQSPLAGGTINGINARGNIDFRTRSASDNKLSVEVENVNLPQGTVLQVFVGDRAVGQIVIGPPPMRGGELEISTRDGGSLPTLVAGQPISVRTGAGAVLMAGVVQQSSFTAVPPLPGTINNGDDKGGSSSGSGSSSSGGGSSSGSGNSGGTDDKGKNNGSNSGSGGSSSGGSSSGSGNSNGTDDKGGNSNSGGGGSNSGSGNSGGTDDKGKNNGSNSGGSSNSGSGSSNSGSGSSNSGGSDDSGKGKK
jgi:hypothetical protein